MATASPISTKRVSGGSFLLEERDLNDVFTPEDFTEEHKQIAATTEEFANNEIVPNAERLENKEFTLTRELLSVPGVSDGLFFDPGMASRRTPRRAAVPVAPGLEPEAILRVLRHRVDAAFLPRPLILVAELPRTETGKVPRAELLALLEAARARARDTA